MGWSNCANGKVLVCQWIGNTVSVDRKHYVNVFDPVCQCLSERVSMILTTKSVGWFHCVSGYVTFVSVNRYRLSVDKYYCVLMCVNG